MKKNYFMLAAATAMFAACAETDLVNEATVMESNAPQAIGFESFANKTTRAEIEDIDDLKQNGYGFVVWGYKTNTENPDWNNQATVFGRKEVTWDGAWSYTPLVYWDKMSTYKFYAAAPAGEYTIDPTTGYITINNAQSAISSDSKDYLVTRGVVNGVGTQNSAVSFDFHHTMTKVTVKLARSISETVTVTSLTMSGWNNAKGTFTQNSDLSPATTNDIDEWELATPEVPGSVKLVGAGTSQGSVTLSTNDAYNVTDYYIMVPQAIAANTLTFTLDYEINGEEFTAHVGKLTEAQTWGTDVHVTYTVIVGPNTIAFDVASICNWEHNTNSASTSVGQN